MCTPSVLATQKIPEHVRRRLPFLADFLENILKQMLDPL
jgi:hypothetical protein